MSSADQTRETEPEGRQEDPANELPRTIVLQDARGALSRKTGWLLAALGWLGLAIALLSIYILDTAKQDYYDTTGGISESYFEGDQEAADKIAIITIAGVIYDGDGFVKRQIERIRQDDSVKAIVIRVDSPGGTVAGSDYMFHHLKKLRDEKKLPIVVSMGSIAASGGYYVSMAVGDQEDSIYAEPTTTTGSIGVIIPHYDVSGFLADHNIKEDSIASHSRKQMLSMTKAIPEEHRAILQSHVDDFFELFKVRVKEGRPHFVEHEQELIKVATGEVFTADKALEHGLVDKIGFIEDAIGRAAELAGVKADEVRVVRYSRPEKLIDISTFAQARGPSDELSVLFDLSTPRAYFLATSLPPLIRNKSAD